MPGGEDDVAVRLDALADVIQRSNCGAVQVEREAYGWGRSVRVTPPDGRSLGLWWLVSTDQLIVETAGTHGGRWELGLSARDLAFAEDVVRSVVAGRVREVRVSDRSRVSVTLADGSEAVETGGEGCLSIFPKPLWTRWGRHVQYLPYLR
jgi:hypothetical protein